MVDLRNLAMINPADDDLRARDPLRARKKAMDYLARREHGRQELLVKLEAAGFEPETASAALEQLARDGLQDDRRFAESFVRSRIEQGKGPVRIRLELQQRGLDGPLVDEVLEAAGEDWGALASRIRVGKFGPGQPADFPEKARQMRFLQYRGFESEHIRRALDDSG
jgi:regulatory protein